MRLPDPLHPLCEHGWTPVRDERGGLDERIEAALDIAVVQEVLDAHSRVGRDHGARQR